jgi:glycosyltransferase involved in cell wall biosynthesis
MTSNQFTSMPIPITEQQWEEGTLPLISITCITFNHANFIRKAIEGFLSQETSFPVEILIHDDASSDGTTEIVREYQKRFPLLIQPIYQEVNQLSQGINPFIKFLFPSAHGKYIAICEGDDYWIDPLKLQKQIDFLEAHPGYSAASHQSLVVYADETNKKTKLFNEHNFTDIELDNLLDGRLFHTASLVFRSEIIKRHSLPADITAGDRALFFLLASFGKIYYFNETMCCYRKHTGGISSWVTTEMLEKDMKIVPWISQINPDFPKHRYYQFLHLAALDYPTSLSIIKLIKHSLLYIYHSLFIKPYNLHNIKMFVSQQFPALLTKVRK